MFVADELNESVAYRLAPTPNSASSNVLGRVCFSTTTSERYAIYWLPFNFSFDPGDEPQHCDGTATALPQHCHSTAAALPQHCHSTTHPPTAHRVAKARPDARPAVDLGPPSTSTCR